MLVDDTEFQDRDTERFTGGARLAKWEPFRRQAEKRLRILDAATSLADLAALNSNRLEGLRASARDSIQSASTSNGASALNGRKTRPVPKT